ncbi:MAG: DUF1801 domain-containing protein [Burkholderiales bacterium]|nr:DUF1801 domain-containing protein [Burkholderiales bacterium]
MTTVQPAAAPEAIEADFSAHPAAVQAVLRQVRQAILAEVPDGQERISYSMPAVFHHGVVVYYAAFKKHIGLYPPVRNAAVRKQVAPYAGPKGNLQFPLSAPMPLELIGAVARARMQECVQENLAKAGKRGA